MASNSNNVVALVTASNPTISSSEKSFILSLNLWFSFKGTKGYRAIVILFFRFYPTRVDAYVVVSMCSLPLNLLGDSLKSNSISNCIISYFQYLFEKFLSVRGRTGASISHMYNLLLDNDLFGGSIQPTVMI
jgi:hypothetical protein